MKEPIAGRMAPLSELLACLPPQDLLERMAKIKGALLRRREIDNAGDLLRLILVYAMGGLSFKQTAAWAQLQGIAKISDVALMDRFGNAGDFMEWLINTLLSQRIQRPFVARGIARLLVVDGTCISQPGSRGTDWRVHMGFDLANLYMNQVALTDASGGESLLRWDIQPGDLVLADSGYAHRGGLAKVREAGGDFLVRINWQNVPLTYLDGSPFDILAAARTLEENETGDNPLVVTYKDQAMPVRLVIWKKSDNEAEKSRQRVIKERRKKGRKVDPRTIEAAAYVFVLTSAPVERLSAREILALYRFRWQVELAFKRLKSLLGLGDLPVKRRDLARTFILAKLLTALLLEEMTERCSAFFPSGTMEAGVSLGNAQAFGCPVTS